MRQTNGDIITGFPNSSGFATNNVGIGTASPTWNFKLTVDNRDDGTASTNDRNGIHVIAKHVGCNWGYGILVNTNPLTATHALSVQADNGHRAIIFGNGMSWFKNRMIIGGASPTDVCNNDELNGVALEVNGTGTITSGMWSSSDLRFKENIVKIGNTKEIIKNLNPVSYQFKVDEFKDKNFLPGTTYGFIAQELIQVLPNSVRQERDGYYSINYTTIIPVLTAAIKEQQDQIEKQQKEIEALKNTSSKSNITPSLDKESKLFQNNPNPFDATTTISYYLDEMTVNAALYIYDLNGKQIKKYDLNSKGQGSLKISSEDLASGMYIYTLIADGKEIDSKRMILTGK
jgi:hypothetical protein